MKTVIEELSLAINELKAGMYESVYNRLVDIQDELIIKELSSSEQADR